MNLKLLKILEGSEKVNNLEKVNTIEVKRNGSPMKVIKVTPKGLTNLEEDTEKE